MHHCLGVIGSLRMQAGKGSHGAQADLKRRNKQLLLQHGQMRRQPSGTQGTSYELRGALERTGS